MQIAGVAVRRFGAPGFDHLRQPVVIRPVMAGELFKKGEPACGVKLVVAIEQLARHRSAGGLAAAGQQRLAEFEQLARIMLAVVRSPPAQQRAAAFGNRREQVGEEGVGHGGPAIPNRLRDLGSN